MFMWTYTTNTVAHNAFDTPETTSFQGVTVNGHDYQAKYIIANESIIVIDHGKKVSDFLDTNKDGFKLTTAEIMEHKADGTLDLGDSFTVDVPSVADTHYITRTVLDASSEQYNDAGNWVGVLYAVQALGSVVWAVCLPRFRSRKFSYTLSLILGGLGFILTAFITNPWLLFISFLLIGCAWAAMLAWPFTILTNSLHSGNIGAYLGLFNCTICIPQIIAALVGGWILTLLSTPDQLAPEYLMIMIAGISLIIGSFCVFFIKEGKSSDTPVQENPVESETL